MIKWTREQLESLVFKKADQYGVPRDLAYGQVTQESNWNPNAYNPSGYKKGGDSGLMQLSPPTAKMLGVTDPFDPVQNVDAGMRYLAEQYKRFGRDPVLAAAAYNTGPGAVEQHGGVPSYGQNHVKKVFEYAAEYRKRFGDGVKAVADFVIPTASAADDELYDDSGNAYRWDDTLETYVPAQPEKSLMDVAKERSFSEQLSDFVPRGPAARTALQGIGGVAGMALGGAPGVAAKAASYAPVVGGFLGTAIGGAIDDFKRKLEGEPVPQPESALRDTKEAAASEAGGLVLGKAAQGVAQGGRWLKNKVLPPSLRAGQTIRDAQTIAGEVTGDSRLTPESTPTAAEVAPGLTKIQNATEATLGGGAIAERTKARSKLQEAYLESVRTRGLPSNLEKGSTPAGKIVQGAADRFHTTQKAIADNAKKPLDATGAMDTVTVNPVNTQKAIEDIPITPGSGIKEKINAKEPMTLNKLWDLRKIIDTSIPWSPQSANTVSKMKMDIRDAMTKDIEDALAGANPAALPAWRQYQQVYRNYKEVTKATSDEIRAKDTPRDIFNWINDDVTDMAKAKAVATVDEWKAVASEKTRQLGLARNSSQGSDFESFNVETYLTNMAKFVKDEPSKAKLLFGHMMSDLKPLLRQAESMKSASATYNFSNTARTWATITALSGLTGAGAGYLAGDSNAGMGTAAMGFGLAAGGASGMARLFTNPGFVKWLAEIPKGPVKESVFMKHVGKLAGLQFEDPQEKQMADELAAKLSSP